MRRNISLFVILMGAAAGLLVMQASGSTANTTTAGIDVQTAGNDAATVGSIETCRQVNLSEEFDVDVWIKDVAGLRAWELEFAYDPGRITVLNRTFLMVTGSQTTDPFPGTDGSHYIGVGKTSGGPIAGDGVLTRVTLKAIGTGVAALQINDPTLNPGTDPFYIDGGVTGANIAIGESCGAVTPPPTQTPRPTPSPSPTPTPSATPSPTPTPFPTDTPRPTNTFWPTIDYQTDTPAPSVSPGFVSFTPTPTPVGGTHTPAPLPDQDPDCDGDYDGLDALRVLRSMAGVDAPIDGCPDVGQPTANGVFADTDCNGLIAGYDALIILAHSGRVAQPASTC